MPAGAFGDSLSGLSLAGGIAAALAKKARTGEGTVVDGSLLATAMWSMQMATVGTAVAMASGGASPAPASVLQNPLVRAYQTADERWLMLCMLQPDRYFEGLVRAVGRGDMMDDPRFATPEARREHTETIVEELAKTFGAMRLEEARAKLDTQSGQWDVVQRPLELLEDRQAEANRFVQRVDYGEGRSLPMFTTPLQFDRTAPELAPAPEFTADTEAVLRSIGMSDEEILEAKIAGAVV